MKIFILGFMGNGKTTIGKRLAELLHYPFIDLDNEIEKCMSLTVEEIFFIHGEQFFRQKEHEQLIEISKRDNMVIAVGGGTPCFFDNMEIMNREGLTVYLQLSPEQIIQRILSMPREAVQARPLIADKNTAELEVFVREALKKREPYYNQAKIIVENHHNQIDLTVKTILERLKQYNN
ncbi:MAG: shikimate kinase [Bacteroidales bacterium]|nr:shikimate kinase [Bacteroidales bacterium]